jgi:hypothetical protein
MTKALETIQQNNIYFDILFLGVINLDKDEKLIGNINKCTMIYAGTHGYLINNKNIETIKNNLQYMNMPIDINIFDKNMNNKIIVYKINESIVNQNNMESTIR